ncbi:cation transporter [Mariniphaga sediminis]|uniref:Cation transporter n=1 Tax=Mariniphaga sediminis TaxID=1628158 RepID=A0A399D002_9BACT|nr:cation diffusion facilitator family transporter [Mariniphaga sediminis]RIH64917.1 cation transporter [Mariniphaga sediminis]
MAHTHEHTHQISHGKAFALGIGLNIVFVVVEIVYGLLANSSALLADAGHNASDVLGLAFAWTAAWLATLRPRGKYTYGLRKTTILVSILNALFLFGAVVAIGWDAVGKLQNPQPVGGKQVMIVAGIGVVINSLTALLFIRGQKEDLNIRGAFLHMAADAGVSLGVVLAGLLISLTGKTWIDPMVSFVIIAVILWGTWRLFSDSVNLALDAVPKNIDIEKVRLYIESKNGVQNLHDLHVWAISTTQVALTAHLVMPGGNDDDFISQLQDDLKKKFNIRHTTFQIENENLQQVCDTDC